MNQLKDGTYSKTGNKDEFIDIYNKLMYHDQYLTMADYDAYIKAQDAVNETYRVRTGSVLSTWFLDLPEVFQLLQDNQKWARMAILNVASAGKFSSDRTIAEYGREIWGIEPSWEALPEPHVS